MSSLTKLYLIAGLQVIVQSSRLLWPEPETALIRLTLALILLVLATVFMYEDINLRKLSKIYLLYVLISPLGIVIYHLLHARKHPTEQNLA